MEAEGRRFRPCPNQHRYIPWVYRSSNPDPWRATWINRKGQLVQADRSSWESAMFAALWYVEHGGGDW